MAEKFPGLFITGPHKNLFTRFSSPAHPLPFFFHFRHVLSFSSIPPMWNMKSVNIFCGLFTAISIQNHRAGPEKKIKKEIPVSHHRSLRRTTLTRKRPSSMAQSVRSRCSRGVKRKPIKGGNNIKQIIYIYSSTHTHRDEQIQLQFQLHLCKATQVLLTYLRNRAKHSVIFPHFIYTFIVVGTLSWTKSS